MQQLYAQTSPSRLDLRQITVNEAETASNVPEAPVTPTSEVTEFSDSESLDLSRAGVQVHGTPSVIDAVSFTSLYIYTHFLCCSLIGPQDGGRLSTTRTQSLSLPSTPVVVSRKDPARHRILLTTSLTGTEDDCTYTKTRIWTLKELAPDPNPAAVFGFG